MKLQENRLVKFCRRAWEESGRGRWLVAVSGGADSTALLLALHKAAVPIEAAHCNFNLRGTESLRDRDFTVSFCRRLDIPLHLREFDTLGEKADGESVEMACRRLRYDFFRDLKKEFDFRRIAVAHNADDNIETFFINALRGSGSRGLKAMSPDNGHIVRPLLEFSRNEILQFLEINNQNFIVDSSNLESDFRRNFLRNEVFPLLRHRWQGFGKAIASTIEIQSRENRIIEHFLRQTLHGHESLLPWSVLREFPDAETLIFRFISPSGGSPETAKEMAASASRATAGKSWKIGNTHNAVFTREGIRLFTVDTGEKTHDGPPCQWKSLQLTPDLMDAVKDAPLSECYLPYDENYYRWLPADRNMTIKSLGLKGTQKVWKVLKDKGLPALQRQKFMVLICRETGQPIWLPGIKRSRSHLISGTEKNIYRVTLDPENN